VADMETVVWRIHAGKSELRIRHFLESNYIAIGWRKMGTLSLRASEHLAEETRLGNV
jgi:hypothetical protein